MDTILTLLMAAFFLWAGIICIQRPRQVVNFVLTFFANASGNPDLAGNWGQSGMLIFIVRLFGLMSLINFVLQLYLLTAAPTAA